MLIEFSVENFKCFAEKQTLDMRPDPDITSLDENLIRTGLVDEAGEELVLLPSVAIYGANASGKSSLLEAFTTFKTLATNKTPVTLNNQHFKFNNKKTMLFECEFFLAGREEWFDSLITANYEFDCAKNIFVKEKYHVSQYNTELKQWEQTTILDRNYQQFKLDYTFFNSLEGMPAEQIEKFLSSLVSEGRSLLSYDAREIPFLKDVNRLGVFNYFESYLVETHLGINLELNRIFNKVAPVSSNVFTNEPLKKKLISIMKKADFAIDDIVLAERKDLGGRSVFELLFYYSANPKIAFSFDEQSSGTKLFLVLFSILIALEDGAINLRYIYDELETHLHPDLCRAIIELFNNPETNPKGSQLIFTTHNQDFMAPNLMRPDQIYFVNKDQATGASELYRASDFEDFDWNSETLTVRKAYHYGLLGSSPRVRRLTGE